MATEEDPLKGLATEEKQILADLARAKANGRINRRDLLKAGGMVGAGAAMGAGGAGALMGTAAADASTSDSDGDIGTPSNRVDIFADGIDMASLNGAEVINPTDNVQNRLDNLSDGDTVVLGAGTFDAPLTIKNDNITIIGQGRDATVIESDDLSTDGIDIGGHDGIEIYHLTIHETGNSTSTNQAREGVNGRTTSTRDQFYMADVDILGFNHAITLQNVQDHAVIANVYLEETGDTGLTISSDGGNECKNVVVKDCHAHNTTEAGFETDTGSAGNASNIERNVYFVRCLSTGGGGFEADENSKEITFRDCVIKGGGSFVSASTGVQNEQIKWIGCEVHDSSGRALVSRGDDNRIIDCEFYNATDQSIEHRRGLNPTVRGCRIEGSGGEAIDVNEAQGTTDEATIQDNEIIGVDQRGILVTGSITAKIDSNYIENVSQGSGDVPAIDFSGGSADITDNTCIDTQGTATTQNGIYSDGSDSDALVAGNRVETVKGAGIFFDSFDAFDDTAIAGNYVFDVGGVGIQLQSSGGSGTAVTDVVVQANQIVNPSNDGVQLLQDMDRTRVVENHIKGAGSNGVQVADSTCDNTLITRNVFRGNTTDVDDSGTGTTTADNDSL